METMGRKDGKENGGEGPTVTIIKNIHIQILLTL